MMKAVSVQTQHPAIIIIIIIIAVIVAL